MVKLIPRYKNSQPAMLPAPQPVVSATPAIEMFKAKQNPTSQHLDRYEHEFAQSLIRQGKETYDVPEELVPAYLMTMAAGVFEDYTGIRMSNEEPKRGFWASLKRALKHQAWRLKSKDKILARALDAVPSTQMVTFSLGLAIHAAQRFEAADDAVDFMLTLSEALAAKSASYSCGYAAYTRQSEQVHAASGVTDELRGSFDTKERRNGIYAIMSVRGRLAALCFAQAEEKQHTFAIAADILEFAEACRDMGRANCQILFKKPWCLFDAQYYQSL